MNKNHEIQATADTKAAAVARRPITAKTRRLVTGKFRKALPSMLIFLYYAAIAKQYGPGATGVAARVAGSNPVRSTKFNPELV